MPPWLSSQRLVCENGAPHDGNVNIKVRESLYFQDTFFLPLGCVVIVDGTEMKCNGSLKMWNTVLRMSDTLHSLLFLILTTIRNFAVLPFSCDWVTIKIKICNCNINGQGWNRNRNPVNSWLLYFVSISTDCILQVYETDDNQTI